jgi:hypothetical protein
LATKELAVASRQCTVLHFLFHQKQHDIAPHLLYFSLFPRLKLKPKVRHFDTIEVIEAESQAVLNTLIKHDFQDAFKKWQKCWKGFMCV